jgi:hypothetical protein
MDYTTLYVSQKMAKIHSCRRSFTWWEANFGTIFHYGILMTKQIINHQVGGGELCLLGCYAVWLL